MADNFDLQMDIFCVKIIQIVSKFPNKMNTSSLLLNIN